VLQMESLVPIDTESGSLDDRSHLISPTSSDANGIVDTRIAIEEHDAEIDEHVDKLRRALLSSLIGVGDTEAPSLEHVLETRERGWLRKALFAADGRDMHVRETTAILFIHLILPKKAYASFEKAYGKGKKALVKRCETELSSIVTVSAFWRIKSPHIPVLAEHFLSKWMGIMKQRGEKAVGDLLKSKYPTEKEGWLRFALFGKDIKDPVESNEETVILLTYLASRYVRTEAIDEAIDFAWGISVDARESLFRNALATTASMLKTFRAPKPTSTRSKRLTR
jgi:hypothetical protein